MKHQKNYQRLPSDKNNRKKMLNSESPFAVKEAYNSVRTNIMFTNMGQKCPVYVITSPLPNEGKTINAVNLSISFAQMEKKTLLIDADMRNPTVHHFFESASTKGFSEILAGFDPDIGFEPTDIPNLHYLNAGRIPPNPAELIAGSRLDLLLENARKHYDYIFIDTPPICVVTDASVLAKKATGYILIIKNEKSDSRIIRHAVNILDKVGASIVGFVLNDVNPKKTAIYKSSKTYDKRYHYYKKSTAAL